MSEPYKPGLAKQGISSDRLSFGKAVFLKEDGGVKPIEYMVCAKGVIEGIANLRRNARDSREKKRRK